MTGDVRTQVVAVARLRSELASTYVSMHADPPAEVRAHLAQQGIRDYRISRVDDVVVATFYRQPSSRPLPMSQVVERWGVRAKECLLPWPNGEVWIEAVEVFS